MEAMLKSMGKGSQNLKILVNPNYSNFIIVKKEENADNLTTIVSFFQKTQNSICSNMVLPANRMQRAKYFHTLAPELCEITATGSEIRVDCVSQIFDSVVPNFCDDAGIIMFDYKTKTEKDTIQIEVSPKFVLTEFVLDPANFTAGQIKFKVDRLKVFPIILNNGFILSIVTPEEDIITYLTVENPETGFVGSCGNNETTELFNFLLSLWGGNVFTVNISNGSGKVFLDKSVCESFNDPSMSLIKMTRKINDLSATVQKLADQYIND